MWISKKRFDRLMREKGDICLNIGYRLGHNKGLYDRIIKLESVVKEAEEILGRYDPK